MIRLILEEKGNGGEFSPPGRGREGRISFPRGPFSHVLLGHELAHWKLGHRGPLIQCLGPPDDKSRRRKLLEEAGLIEAVKKQLEDEQEAWKLAKIWLTSGGEWTSEIQSFAEAKFLAAVQNFGLELKEIGGGSL